MNLLTLVFFLYLNELGQPVDKCLTGKIIEEFQKTGKISVSTPVLSKKADYYTTHFVIHYDPTQVPTTYVESTAKYFEYSWEIEVDTLGWDAPPIDPSVGYYEVTLSDLSGGVLGYTYPYAPGPDPTQEDYYSYIVVDINLPYSTLKATVSHEFNHACQFSYTAFDATFFYENCATWIEDLVYDNINDYIGYLNGTSPIKNPWLNITSTLDLYEYAGCLFPMFLSEWLNTPNVVRDIWALMGVHSGNNTLKDIDSILKTDYGKTLEEAFTEYAEWRFFVGVFNDGYHFEEAGSWPNPFVENVTSYPFSGDNSAHPLKEFGSAYFIRFLNVNSERLVISFQGDWVSGRPWNVRLFERSTPPYPEWDMPLTDGQGTDTTNGGVNQIYMVVSDAKWKAPVYSNVYFNYSADFYTSVGERIVSDIRDIKIKFSPKNGRVLIQNKGEPVVVTLVNSSGRSRKLEIKKGLNTLFIRNKGPYFMKLKENTLKFIVF